MTACVCCHSKGEHRHGKGACGLCACTLFVGHRPPLLDDGAQLALFAEEAAHERARIFDAVATSLTGLTHEEVVARTGINANSVRGRLSEMLAERVLVALMPVRKVASGRRATVYRMPVRRSV